MPDDHPPPRADPADDEIDGQLEVIWGAEPGRPYSLRSQARIGRGQDCDVLLDDDKASRLHARVTRLGFERYELQDLGSTNGTQVNGERIERRELVDGDILQVGRHRLRFTRGFTILYESHLRQYSDRPIVAALEEQMASTPGEPQVSLVLFALGPHSLPVRQAGWSAIEAVTQHVEAIVRRGARPGDTFARTGPEEFALVLPGLGEEAARSLAQDVRHAVDDATCVHEGRELHPTLAVGVAPWSSDILRPWQLLREVERRLREDNTVSRTATSRCG